MTGIARRFIGIGILYALVGMVLGIIMAASGDHSRFPLHAHVQLVGWVTLALYGLVYHAFPGMARSRLAAFHFWLANAGALILSVGVYIVFAYDIDAVAAVGSILTITATALFLVIFLRDGQGAPL